MSELKSIGVIQPETHVTCARFSPCGRVLLAPSFDGKVRRWKMERSGEAPTFPPAEMPSVAGHNGFATAVAFHPSKEIAYSADSWGRLMAWNYLAESPQPLWTLPEAHDGWIRAIDIGPQGQWIATAGRDGRARIFSSEDGKKLAEFSEHNAELFAIAAHPGGNGVVTGDLHGRIIHWDTKNGVSVKEFDGKIFHLLSRLQDVGGLRKLAFDREGKSLYACGARPNGGGNVQGHGRVLIFDFEKGTLRQEVIVGENDQDIFVHDVALLPDGGFIAVTTGQPGQGKVMHFLPGEAKPVLTHNKGTVNCHSAALSPDHKWLAISATNSGSNGNGRKLDKDGKYPGNFSPIHLFILG